MIEVSKNEKEYLTKKLPWLHVVVLNRQKSNQKKYMVQEDKNTVYWLSMFETRKQKKLWSAGDMGVKQMKRVKSYGR